MSAWHLLIDRVRKARFDRHEIAGSLGDLGTFIPLLVGMVVQNGLDFASALFFAGFFNVLTGLAFTIPMAVQPMKAIAAVAIAEGLTVPQILAAGIITSAVIFLLGLTRLIEALNRVVPISVVRGLQLALGLTLLIQGIGMVAGTRQLWGLDSVAMGIGGFLLVLFLFFSPRWPAALVLFGVGIAAAVISRPDLLDRVRLGMTIPHLVPIGWEDFQAGLLRAAIPQVPLTTLNSVIAVCALSADLFPDRAAQPRPVAVSVGLMNLVSCWFGAMPMCHGSGGLAGQYRFGARTNGSILFLGAMKMALAVLFGGSLFVILQDYPHSILGVLLMFSGLELALVTRDMTNRTDAFVLLLTAAACLALKSTAMGFVAGFVLAKLFYSGVLRALPATDDPR